MVKKNIKFIDTKYCCLCGDDDYLFTKNINKFIYFLKMNKSFIGVGGITYLMRPYKNTFSFKKLFSTNLINNYAYLRLKKHTINYINPHYSICKTSAFSKAINLVKKSKYPHDMFNDELVLNLTLVCFGKFKHLNKTHLFRLIGHEKNNLSKNKNKNAFNYSKNNIVLELKKLIQKIDKKEYKNLDKELANCIGKTFSIKEINYKYIKIYLSRFNFKESRIFYFLKKILLLIKINIEHKNSYFLTLNDIMLNKKINSDIKVFIENFIKKF